MEGAGGRPLLGRRRPGSPRGRVGPRRGRRRRRRRSPCASAAAPERRTLRWNVSPALQRGQRLVLAESAGQRRRPRGAHRARKSQGRQAFAPVVGPKGVRRIEATIVTDGFGSPARTVARYAAPPTNAPSPVRNLALRRKGAHRDGVVAPAGARSRGRPPRRAASSAVTGASSSTSERRAART